MVELRPPSDGVLPPDVKDGNHLLDHQQKQLQPDGLTPAHIFVNEGFVLSPFGQRLQSLFVVRNSLLSLSEAEVPTPQRAQEFREQIARTCEELGIAGDEGSLTQFGMKFYALVRQRQEEIARRSRLVLTEA